MFDIWKSIKNFLILCVKTINNNSSMLELLTTVVLLFFLLNAIELFIIYFLNPLLPASMLIAKWLYKMSVLEHVNRLTIFGCDLIDLLWVCFLKLTRERERLVISAAGAPVIAIYYYFVMALWRRFAPLLHRTNDRWK